METTIARKISEVMAACNYVQKKGRNKEQGYNYVAACDILEKVNDEITKRGIASVVTPTIAQVDSYTSKSGNVFQRVVMCVSIRLVDSESGESVTICGFGCGSDTGDKAIMKAQTAAIKYAWMLTLNISTGDDPEADESVDAQPAASTATENTPGTITTPAQQKMKPAPSPAESAPIADELIRVKLKDVSKTLGEWDDMAVEWIANNYTFQDVKEAAARVLDFRIKNARDKSVMDAFGPSDVPPPEDV